MANTLSRSSTNVLLKDYADALRSCGWSPARTNFSNFRENSLPLAHALWMCEEAITFSQEDKKQRWLGFIQAILWMHKAATLDELKAHVVDAYARDGMRMNKPRSPMCIVEKCKREAQVISDHVTSFCKKHSPRPA